MARLNRPEEVNENPNPAKKFFHWKSNDKNFEYYDKTQKDNPNKGKVSVELPLKLLFLEHYSTVKGWSDSAESGIWSNEVYNSFNSELEVKNSNGTICKGLYKDNKALINNAGGKFYKSIYCMTEDGEIINLQLKGACIGGIKKEKSVNGEEVYGWSTFYGGDKKRKIKGNSHLLDNQWFEINEVRKGKSGSVKYSIPFFEVGEVLTKKENELADIAVLKLQSYMDNYFSKDNTPVNEIEVKEPELVVDDLEF